MSVWLSGCLSICPILTHFPSLHSVSSFVFTFIRVSTYASLFYSPPSSLFLIALLPFNIISLHGPESSFNSFPAELVSPSVRPSSLRSVNRAGVSNGRSSHRRPAAPSSRGVEIRTFDTVPLREAYSFGPSWRCKHGRKS